MRRVSLLSLAVLATALAGCGEDEERSTRVKGDTLTVYASLPTQGLGAEAGKAAELGMRQALSDADGRIAGRTVRLVPLPSTRLGDEVWDPGTVEANAERAAADDSAIAYIGELDQGGSAVSLPVTNRTGLLHVSPADGLTSLTRTPPGRPRAGPERYYPEGKRNFVRLVPPDLKGAREIVAALRERGSRRLAVVDGEQIADRELDSMVASLIGTGFPHTVERVAIRNMDEAAKLREHVADVVETVIAARPDAILYAGAAGAEAGALLGELSVRLSDVPVFGGPPLAAGASRFPRSPEGSCAMTGVAAPPRTSRAARRLVADVRRWGAPNAAWDALLGYDAMRLVLDAIEDGGPDRRRVAVAAREPERRQGLMGGYSVDRRGDPQGREVVCLPLSPAVG